MLEAASAAVRSACLSRQVGASVYNSDAQLLGVGCNDVPKHKGGLYTEGPNDQRCFHWKEKECHNDKQKMLLAKKIADALNVSEENANIISDILDSGVGNLIEFSRSVHAEMEAIVSVSRTGSGSLLGGTLYTTTFPCHNCARHIVAAGIDRVIYVEPYSKSLALELHSDSITLQAHDASRVRFLQYEDLRLERRSGCSRLPVRSAKPRESTSSWPNHMPNRYSLRPWTPIQPLRPSSFKSWNREPRLMAKPDNGDSNRKQLSLLLPIDGSRKPPPPSRPPHDASRSRAKEALLKDLEKQGLRNK